MSGAFGSAHSVYEFTSRRALRSSNCYLFSVRKRLKMETALRLENRDWSGTTARMSWLKLRTEAGAKHNDKL